MADLLIQKLRQNAWFEWIRCSETNIRKRLRVSPKGRIVFAFLIRLVPFRRQASPQAHFLLCRLVPNRLRKLVILFLPEPVPSYGLTWRLLSVLNLSHPMNRTDRSWK